VGICGARACALGSDIVERSGGRTIRLWRGVSSFSTGCANCCGNVEKRKVRIMRAVRFGLTCKATRETIVCRLRRVRDATRLKPRSEAVGGSRKSASEVDESETGSTNERASFGRLFHLPGERPHARLRRACLRCDRKAAASPNCLRAARQSRAAGGIGFVKWWRCTCGPLRSITVSNRSFGRLCSFSFCGSGCSPSASPARRRSSSRSCSGR
jgi:hypothetical protein